MQPLENHVSYSQKNTQAYRQLIATPVGNMIAIGNNSALFLLAFQTQPNLEKNIRCLQGTNGPFSVGTPTSIQMISEELQAYFNGTLTQFKTPYLLFGTPFQIKVWEFLSTIPYGQVMSYSECAKELFEKKTTARALANANSQNRLALILPCHRVIRHHGALGGYHAGLAIKKYLLAHEQASYLKQ